jgi:hypothetical protein
MNTTNEINYTTEQVAPVMKRLMAHINTLNEAELLAQVTEAKDGVRRAFEFTIEDGAYTLQVFGNGITILRGTERQHIHSSGTTITHLSRILRNSARRF